MLIHKASYRRYAFQVIVTLSAVASLTGCQCIQEHSLTARLWNSRSFQEIRSVSTNPPVKLFYSAEADDFLIVYSEVSDENANLRDRAYFIRHNASATEHGKKPHFTTVEAQSLSPVPFSSDGVNLPRATLDRTLLTVTDSRGTETYTLASYPRGTATAFQVILTPFAVAGDVTITGLIVGFIGLVGMAQSGVSISVD